MTISLDRKQIVFQRDWLTRVIFDAFLLWIIPLSLWATFYTLFRYTGPDLTKARIVSLCMLLYSPWLLWGRIYAGNIHVDDDGIGWWLWGKRWRYIRWSDITMMRLYTVRTYNHTPPFMTIYGLYTTRSMGFLASQIHGMRFDDNIPNAEALIAAVNRNLQRYNVPTLDLRKAPK